MNLHLLFIHVLCLHIFGCAAFCQACLGGKARLQPPQPMGHHPSLHSRPSRDTAIYQSDITIGEEEEEESYQSASTTLHKVTVPLPKPVNLFSKLTFAWARELLVKGNKKRLELTDMWLLPEEMRMESSSARFQNFYRQEEEVQRKKNIQQLTTGSVLKQYWSSPVTRAIIKM